MAYGQGGYLVTCGSLPWAPVLGQSTPWLAVLGRPSGKEDRGSRTMDEDQQQCGQHSFFARWGKFVLGRVFIKGELSKVISVQGR